MLRYRKKSQGHFKVRNSRLSGRKDGACDRQKKVDLLIVVELFRWWRAMSRDVSRGADTRLKYGDYTHNLDRLDIYIVSRQPANHDNYYRHNDDNKKTRLHLRGGGRQLCGSITRLNDALFKPMLHLQCSQAVRGRYIYVEAHGVANRWTRLFSAVLCEVMVYE